MDDSDFDNISITINVEEEKYQIPEFEKEIESLLDDCKVYVDYEEECFEVIVYDECCISKKSRLEDAIYDIYNKHRLNYSKRKEATKKAANEKLEELIGRLKNAI